MQSTEHEHRACGRHIQPLCRTNQTEIAPQNGCEVRNSDDHTAGEAGVIALLQPALTLTLKYWTARDKKWAELKGDF